MPESQPVERQTEEFTELSRTVLYSLLGGSTSLIPIPFLDDWIFQMVRRQMAWELFRRKGLYLEPRHTKLLASRPSAFISGGCLYKAAMIMVIMPLKMLGYIIQRLSKKILFVLAIKEASDRASQTFHEAFLLQYAAQRKRGSPVPDDRAILQLRDAVSETMLELNTSPIRSIYRSVVKVNRGLMSKAAKVLRTAFQGPRHNRDPEEKAQTQRVLREEEDLLQEVTAEAADRLMGQKGYLEMVLQRFQRIARRRGAL